ncbi:MAG: 16S rRNA (cytosine(1402)-N(4))-methyltransferase RsmH [Clostridia bacterium]|nr:16S rRNA (cytosine(1402)-N(4))-methyltransferase RsmH [Clostridia bacterium]
MSEFRHIPVMLGEVIDSLAVKADGSYLDCTLGGGGHSSEILKRLTSGRLYAVDKDADALTHAKERLGEAPTYIKSDFKDVVANWQGEALDGILMDLGVSSYQLDTPERGFSYRFDGPLDMRMSRESGLTAEQVVNDYSEKELTDVFFKYGEEPYARKIAANIVRERKAARIDSTSALVRIIERSIPPKARYGGSHPAKRVFQAIRIEVNGELSGLYEAVLGAIKLLKKGGRIAVITFHSLEDRIVKQAFKYAALDCICPPRSPICTCGKVSEVTILTNKPILPSDEETENNPRSKSAKLRVAEKKV